MDAQEFQHDAATAPAPVSASQEPASLRQPDSALPEPAPAEQTARRRSALDATRDVALALMAKSESKKEAATPKSKAKQAAKAKAKGKAKAKPAATKIDAKPTPKAAAKKPTWNFEKSRNQIVCRTGLSGPGQTKTIAGMGPSSVKAAKAWLKNQLFS